MLIERLMELATAPAFGSSSRLAKSRVDFNNLRIPADLPSSVPSRQQHKAVVDASRIETLHTVPLLRNIFLDDNDCIHRSVVILLGGQGVFRASLGMLFGLLLESLSLSMAKLIHQQQTTRC
jgi:hypothetical protein